VEDVEDVGLPSEGSEAVVGNKVTLGRGIRSGCRSPVPGRDSTRLGVVGGEGRGVCLNVSVVGELVKLGLFTSEPSDCRIRSRL
jgi:hypothetical protein